jgi:hypothetical protein
MPQGQQKLDKGGIAFFLWKKEVLFNARHFQKTTDLNASDDFEGVMMKISTSNVDVSEPFYINYKYST